MSTKIAILCVGMFYFVQVYIWEALSISTTTHALDSTKHANIPMFLLVTKTMNFDLIGVATGPYHSNGNQGLIVLC